MSRQKANITHGFYYSLTNNYYLNVASHDVVHNRKLLPGQANVTQAEFEAIALAQVRGAPLRIGIGPGLAPCFAAPAPQWQGTNSSMNPNAAPRLLFTKGHSHTEGDT